MKYLKLYESYRHTKHSLVIEKSIEVGDNLIDKLDQIKSPLSNKLKKFLNSDDIRDVEVTKIDFDDQDNKVFTLTDEKGGERKFKFGKLLKYLGYTDEVKGYEIENFIEYFKKSETSNLELRKGKDILNSYLCDNYDNDDGYGNLGKSCMRYRSAQDYLEIYTSNPNQVSCLTLINPDNKKVQGRALVWKMDNGKYFMDRIYTINSEYNSIFKKYASDNNFTTSTSDITLENGGDFDFYPYMDTFKYYTPYEDKLSTKRGDVHMTSTTGGGGRGSLVWSEYMQEEIESDESVYSEKLDDYIYRRDSVEVYNGLGEELSWYPDDNAWEISFTSKKYSDYDGVYAHIEDLHELERNSDYHVLIDDTDIYSDNEYGVYIKSDQTFDRSSPELYSVEVTHPDEEGDYIPVDEAVYLYDVDEEGFFIVDNFYKRDDEGDGSLIRFPIGNRIVEESLIPEEFVREDEDGDGVWVINNDAPFYVDILEDMIKMKSDGVVNLHSNLVLDKNGIETKCKKTKNGYRVFPPMVTSFNDYDYSKWLDWVGGSDNKNYNYFIESFNKGEYLESNILRAIVDKNSYVFDEFNNLATIESPKKLLLGLFDFINLNNSRGKGNGNFSFTNDISMSMEYVSFLSFYKHNGHMIFPYLYSAKLDKYVVYRGDSKKEKESSNFRLYTSNEIINLIVGVDLFNN